MDSRYFLLLSFTNKFKIETLKILDSKMKRVYCGSPIRFDFVSIQEYGLGILSDIKIPINDTLYCLIRDESFLKLRNTNYFDFLKKYSLEEWAI